MKLKLTECDENVYKYETKEKKNTNEINKMCAQKEFYQKKSILNQKLLMHQYKCFNLSFVNWKIAF